MGSVNRREKVRVPLDFKVECLHEGDFIITFTRNVSLDGMFLCTQDPPPPGSRLTLLFPEDGIYEVEVPAVVVWVNHEGAAGEIGMGVQFLSPIPDELKRNLLNRIKRVEVLQVNEIQT